MEQIQLNNTLANQEISFDIPDGFIDLSLRTAETGLYCDLSLNGKALFYGRRCIDRMPLIISPNLITGNLYFKDLYGNENPHFEEFNTRFILIYHATYTIL